MVDGAARRPWRAQSAVLVAGITLAFGCGEPSAERAAPTGPPERLLLIVVDTLRLDRLSFSGGPVETPAIDGLAERGLVLEARASYHQTSMSMASLFTGRTPSIEADGEGEIVAMNGTTWCGLRRFAMAGETRCVPGQLPTLAEALSEQGYWTAAVVTNPLLFRPAGFERGFDTWVELRCDEDAARDCFASRDGEAAQRAAESILASRPDDRFFLYVHLMDAHDYLDARRSYAESVAFADRAVGALLKTLDRSALLEGTVVVLVSDHGEHLGERHLIIGGRSHRGNPSFDEVLRVPVIVSPEPWTPPPDLPFLRGDDVHRYLRRLAGAPDPPAADLAPGELFLSETRFQTYLRGRFKSYRRRGGQRRLLVDLSADPEERHDVSGAFPEVVADHERRVRALAARLATSADTDAGSLSREEARRLEELGYLTPR